ncbi:MAG: transcription-repair coupling factor [Chloroflexi bacterium]|nr:transcription-repair coupling factor [Chloroflexota bacterium]
MALYGLLPTLQQAQRFGEIVERLKSGQSLAAGGILGASTGYLAAALQVALKRPIITVLPDVERARAVFDELQSWSLEPASTMYFPELEGLPYEEGKARPETVRQRAAVLAELKTRPKHANRWFQPLVVASAQALFPRVTPPEDFGAQVITLEEGQRIKPEALLEEWVRMGFEPSPMVEEPGTFTRRGGVLDVFPPAHSQPVRIEFFGDEIESIRLFDAETQLSQGSAKSVTFTPVREVSIGMAGRAQELLEELDFDTCREEEAGRWRQALDALANSQKADDADFYTRFLFERGASLLDYLGEDGCLVFSERDAVARALAHLGNQAEELRLELEREGELPGRLPCPYLDANELVSAAPTLDVTAGAAAIVDLGFRTATSYGGKTRTVIQDVKRWLGDGQRVVVVTLQAQRMVEVLGSEPGQSPNGGGEGGLVVAPVDDLVALPAPGSLTVVAGALKEGWRNADLGVTLLTDVEIFGWAKPRRALTHKQSAPAMLLSDITPGDYVVHVEHGVGQYRGLVQRELGGHVREYLVLQYASTDELYVPVEQIDRISRYIGAGEHKPSLNRLGTQDWERAKSRVKQSIVHLAAQLLALYSQREMAQGIAFGPDTPWQEELENSFPYVETPDQLQAAAEVKADMEKPAPMDRLLCGDVGFGKTEVAVRAAFKAVMSGRQVAVLVPTTVLAEQHLNTFSDRMQTFPVKVDMLSRFRSPKEQKATIDQIKSGEVDILVGTHRILQPDVRFKNLGLLVVDEEQRFGVMHKERLKELRKDVDVLTMTATPIPRTLNMAMVGVRDMSVIETPPEYRQPIKTYLEEYRDDVVRDAILREVRRGGQVYYVHNRVETMAPAIQKLRKLVPEATFIGAHGQMEEGQLEKVMNSFAHGEYDVLVCSTIIESGLDIPNVNTIIINEAGKLGLAQLYQLRGRVGRSAVHAYAYLLFKGDVPLTPQAEKRLRTIFEATDLGAGFKIAMKDLEIRGAGNLLGPEQSGQMNTVGFDLYCKLLAESIQELKGEEVPDTTAKDTVTVDLGLDALIPDEYVGDLQLKMNLYQRLALVTELAQSEALSKEVRDRFGPPPEAVENLFFLLDLKLKALKTGVESIRKRPLQEDVVVQLREGVTFDRHELGKRFGPKLTLGSLQLRLHVTGDKWRPELQRLMDALAKPAAAGIPAAAPAAARR